MPKVLHSRLLIIISALSLVTVFGGCANSSAPALQPNKYGPELSGKPIANRASVLIATDFARALSQIKKIGPDKATLNILPSSGSEVGFGDALRLALFEKSYAVRLGQSGTSGIELSIEIWQQDKNTAGASAISPQDVIRLYQVSVGDISLRRRYLVQSNSRVRPLSPMEGRGLEGARLVVDDSIFEVVEERLDADDSSVSAPDTVSPSSNPEDTVARSIVTLDKTIIRDKSSAALDGSTESVIQPGKADPVKPVVNAVAQDSLQRAPLQAFGESLRNRGIALEQTANFRLLGKSNFYELLKNSVAVESLIIVFPNDSSELTPAYRDTLQALIENNLQPTDVFSVVGTSHGRAFSKGAQKTLSRGRAATIVQALMEIGVDNSRIFAESSWSDTYYDEVMPRRGAVIEIRRAVPATSVD